MSKANNDKPLNERSSWATPASLNGTEIGVWDATVTAANNPKIDGAVALAGIRILNPGGPVTILKGSSSLNSSALTLGRAGLDLREATQNLTLEGPVRLATAQTWAIGSGRQLVLGSAGSVDLGSHYLEIKGAGSASFGENIAGGGSLLLGFDTPASVLKLSAVGYKGATILRGGTLLLEGDSVLAGTARLVLAKGRLEFEGTSLKIADDVPVDLFGDANDGTVVLMKHLGAPSQLAFGILNIRAGESEFEFVGSSPEKLLTVEQLLRDQNLRGAIILGGGASDFALDGETNRVMITQPPALAGGELGTPATGIIPWVTNAKREPMTYDPGSGFRSLKEGEFVTELASDAAGRNVRVETPQMLSEDLSINSFGSTNHVHDLGGYTLTVTSGAIYESTGSNMAIKNGAIDFGSQEGVLSGHIDLSTTTKIKGSGGLTLVNTFLNKGKTIGCPENEFTGGVWVQDGHLSTGDASECIPDTNAVFLARPAVLLIANPSGAPVTETIAALAGEGVARVGNTDHLVIGQGSELASPGSIALIGTGTLSPGNNSGATDLLPGSLRLEAGEAGRTTLSGGTLLLDLASPVLHDSLDVKGGVALGAEAGQGTTLAVQLTHAPQPGDMFLILINEGSDPIEGQFSNGKQVSATFQGKQFPLEILYNSAEAGGDGNDIVLRFGTTPPR